MKKIYTLIFTISVIINNLFSQTYTHPTTGIQNEYVGACMVTTCSGTYYDNGGAGSNYSNSINLIYRVFCPNTVGNCLRVTFNSFNVHSGMFFYDYLTVGNGPTQNSTKFTTAPANASGEIYGTPAVPFSYTSTHASGCLTFRFYSDGSTTRAGWDATLTCVPCAGGPTGLANYDCSTATIACNSFVNPSNASGPGLTSDGCTGVACPAGGENHSNWYYIKILTNGTFGFNIVPQVASDDYDVAVYGPNPNCNSLGSPLRCSDSGATGTTGVNNGDTDGIDASINTLPGNDAGINENVMGDKNLDYINATAGQTYYIMVDEWTPTGAGFNLNFLGTATLDCTLPITLLDFTPKYNNEEKDIQLTWVTESERENDYFTLEKSLNGETFYEIGKIKGAGNSVNTRNYNFIDNDVIFGTNYYRLKQTDFDGKSSYSDTRSVNILYQENYDLIVYPNPSTEKTDLIFYSPNIEAVEINLYDSCGKTISKKKVTCDKGVNYYEIDINDWKEGIYFVTITTPKKIFKNKIIKK